jgi:L-asparagine transporter-like permease
MSDREISGVETAPVSGSPSSTEVEGLHRRLSQRQLTMMAIGGAIGVGLFLGSSVTIRLAGPAVILSYLLGAGIALIMSYVLTEMAVVHPVAGAFGVYAEKYLNPWAGFSVRATYAVAQIIAIGAEVTAAGIYISYWLPNVPQWIWVVLVSAALVALNSMQVNRLGEFEYWFAMIKVAAIVAFIIVGLALIFGVGGRHALGLANLTQHGGFLPAGWKGVWLSLTITVTSYMGVEIIAVTAGEAQHPEVTIPRAMRNIVYRLIGFYVLAIAIMVTMVPWNQTGSSSALSGSPFVTAFAAAHIPFAAAIMNFVVLTAALSSVNTNLYLATRMLFSLGRGGYAPAWMGKRQRRAAPRPAGFNRGDNRGDPAGHLCAEECLPDVVWHRRGGNAFCVARDSQHAFALPQDHYQRAAHEFADASAGTSVFYRAWHCFVSGNFGHHFLRGGIGMVGAGIFSFPGCDLGLVSGD